MRNKIFFTLVELLVVIAIISILMAMLLPALKMAQEMGKQACCSSNLKQIYNAEMLYSTDYNSWPTPAWRSDGGNFQRLLVGGSYLPVPIPSVSAKTWCDGLSIWPYVEPQGVFRCPSEKSPTKSSCGNAGDAWYGAHYGMTFSYVHGAVFFGNMYPSYGRLTQCANPSKRVFFGDRCHLFLIYPFLNWAPPMGPIPIKLRIFEYPITNTEYPIPKFISVLHRLEIESWILGVHFSFLLFLSACRPAQMSVPQYVL